ncbi:MAG: hypothetical protein R3209_12720 [Salinimicrobium sediminis]|nr:hypothetical protein [Salinimicrobium sediminis]
MDVPCRCLTGYGRANQQPEHGSNYSNRGYDKRGIDIVFHQKRIGNIVSPYDQVRHRKEHQEEYVGSDTAELILQLVQKNLF